MEHLKRILGAFCLPLTRNSEFCFFMYTLAMVSAACTVNYQWKQELYGYAWAETALWVYAAAVVLAVMPRIMRMAVHPLIYIAAYAVSIADVYCFVKFEAAINPSILMLVAETDPREAGEFFTSYVTPDILLTNVAWPLLVLFIHIVWTVTVAVGNRRLSRGKDRGERGGERGGETVTARMKKILLHAASLRDRMIPQKHRLKATVLGSRTVWGVIVVAVLALSASLSAKNLGEMYRLMTLGTIGEVEHKLTEKDCGRQYMPLYRVAFSFYANRLTARQLIVLHKVAGTVEVDSCSFRSPEIVFIIGEAYNKRHSQLYGYDRPTTPRQLRMARKGELVAFSDIISPWNLTSYVFKHVMSTFAVGDKGDWCDYPLFCEIFRKAGYDVTFLTNEFLPQAKQQVFDFSGGFFLNDPELSALQFDRRNDKLHIFDEGLLSDYRMIQEERSHDGDTLKRGTLTIFHLIGQHQDYRIRCPNSRKVFKVEDYADRTDLTNPRWKRNLCNYDNATLYNDSVVAAITDLYRDRNAIVIYMPDHGEEVHSRELPHFSGRMHSTTIVKRLAREEFEIPFWIWTSSQYRKLHPEIWKAVKAARNRPMMTDAIAHLLLDLAGIHCRYYRPDLNIISPEYNPKRLRIIKHQTDYDVVMGKNPSEMKNPLRKMENEK